MQWAVGNKVPQVHTDTFIAPSAELLGAVTVGEGSSVWFHTVLRADLNAIVIGTHSNVQDGVVIHNESDQPVMIGDYVTIGHNATIHGCTIGNHVLIGMGAVILSGAVIEEGAIVAAGAVVKENAVVAAHTMVAGVPAKALKNLDPTDIALRRAHALSYETLWREQYKTAADFQEGEAG